MFRNINAEQARRGVTDQEIADLLGITRSTYSRKKNTGNFSLSEVRFLMRYFDCDFDYLFAIDQTTTHNHTTV